MKDEYTSEVKCKNPLLEGIYEILESLVFAIIFVIFLFVFIARLSIVSGASMYPTLNNGDYLVVADPFSTYNPESGDIVVIHMDYYDDPIVKRIIATEGQTIKIRFSEDLGGAGGDVYEIYVDDVLLDEPYAFYDTYNYPFIEPSRDVMDIHYEGKIGVATATVPEGCVFVMGDNRNNSKDSRSREIGFVDEDFILGKCVFRLLPLQKIGALD